MKCFLVPWVNPGSRLGLVPLLLSMLTPLSSAAGQDGGNRLEFQWRDGRVRRLELPSGHEIEYRYSEAGVLRARRLSGFENRKLDGWHDTPLDGTLRTAMLDEFTAGVAHLPDPLILFSQAVRASKLVAELEVAPEVFEYYALIGVLYSLHTSYLKLLASLGLEKPDKTVTQVFQDIAGEACPAKQTDIFAQAERMRATEGRLDGVIEKLRDAIRSISPRHFDRRLRAQMYRPLFTSADPDHAVVRKLLEPLERIPDDDDFLQGLLPSAGTFLVVAPGCDPGKALRNKIDDYLVVYLDLEGMDEHIVITPQGQRVLVHAEGDRLFAQVSVEFGDESFDPKTVFSPEDFLLLIIVHEAGHLLQARLPYLEKSIQQQFLAKTLMTYAEHNRVDGVVPFFKEVFIVRYGKILEQAATFFALDVVAPLLHASK